MGGSRKLPAAPPPPQAPKDEADAVPQAALTAQRTLAAMLGYRNTFTTPRGPGGPSWAPPSTTPAIAAQKPVGLPSADGTGRPGPYRAAPAPDLAGPGRGPGQPATPTTLGAPTDSGPGPLTGAPTQPGGRVNPLTGTDQVWDPVTKTWKNAAGARGGAGGH
jgi:hypothetical protein